MSDELVTQARQALEGTTPGPWYFDNNEGYGANNIWSPHPEDNARADLVAASVGDSAEAEANASFIAAAPTLVAAMADRIEALTDQLAKAVEALRNIAVVGFSSDPSVNAAIAKQTVTQARATLAEIEGEKP